MLTVPPDANVSATGEQGVVRPFRETRNGVDIPGEELPMQLAVARGREVRDVEIQMVRWDGARFDWWVNAVPLFDEQGAVRGCIGAFMDITERKLMEADLALSNDRFNAAMRAVEGIVFEWNLQTQTVYRSEGLFQLVGVRTEDAPPTREWWIERVHPDDVKRLESTLSSILASGDRYEVEYRVRHEAGHWVDVWERGYLQRNPQGEPIGLVGFTTDISDRKRSEADRQLAEIALREAHVQLESALVAGAIYTWRWQISTDRVIVNAAFAHLFAVDPVMATTEGLPIAYFINAIHEEDRARVLAKIQQAIKTGENYAVEYRVRTASGQECWLTARGRADYDVAGNPVSFPGSLVDITERKQAEAAFRQLSAANEQQLRRFDAVASSVPDFIYTFDLSGRFTYINKPLLDLWQKTLAEAVGKNFFELDYPIELAERLQRQIQQVITTRQLLKDETPYTSAVGPRAYEYIFVPLFDADGAVELVAGITRDITDRKRSEAELRESEARFRTLADNMSQFAWMTDATGWIFWYNQRWFDYTGTTLEEMQGWGWQQVHHPEHIDRVVEHFRHSIETGEQWEDTFPLRGKDGTYRWFLSRAQPIRDEAGKIIRWFGTNTDITERKQIEAELRQKNAILDVINESAPTPIFVKDRQGRIIFANPATLKVLGKSASEVIGYRDCDLYLNQEDAARVMENDRRIMESGQMEVVEESPDGIRTFLGMKVPYRNEVGEVIGLIGISNDISDRVRFERDRERILQQEQAARKAAQEANRIKDEFLAVLSHELRSPLNPILGWSKLLQTRKLDETKTALALATIERNARLQTELIEDLLDVSRILQGKLSLNIRPVDLASTVEAAIETVTLAAEAKEIVIQKTLDGQVGQVLGDSSRLQQVVWNLVSNAVKFTSAGGRVEVRLTRVGDRAQITVTDTGKGINPEFLPYVFDYFRQEDGATTRKFGGLGLGLAIVRHLVELHGGTVEADSLGEGQGATFTVRLPLSGTDRREENSLTPLSERSTTDAPLSGMRVLVVDDEPDMRELISFSLEQEGAEVMTVARAPEALTALAEFQPDILLSDVGMPDVDGYMLLRQVRALSDEQGGQVPAIALTAYAGELDQKQALQAGFQQHLAKPIEPDVLVRAIVSLLRKNL